MTTSTMSLFFPKSRAEAYVAVNAKPRGAISAIGWLIWGAIWTFVIAVLIRISVDVIVGGMATGAGVTSAFQNPYYYLDVGVFVVLAYAVNAVVLPGLLSSKSFAGFWVPAAILSWGIFATSLFWKSWYIDPLMNLEAVNRINDPVFLWKSALCVPWSLFMADWYHTKRGYIGGQLVGVTRKKANNLAASTED